MTNNFSVNNVQELVKFITSRRHYSETRWTMWDRSEQVWDNAEAGAAWSAEANELNDKYGTPEYTDEAWKELNSRKPAQHRVTTYCLQEANRNHSRGFVYSDSISLSMELGDAVDAIWTKKQARYGNYQERTGCLTIPGILKRLGQNADEIKGQIKAAEEAEKANAARNSRNYSRRELKRLAAEMHRHLDVLGIGSNISVEMLLNIPDEQ